MFTLYVLMIYLVSLFISGKIINKMVPTEDYSGRNRVVDGLRGVCATLVVLFHFIATFNIETYGNWSPPADTPLSNTGPISVILFFMISGFLFFNVINRETVKWKRFFISRFFRIYPLYLFILLIVFFISSVLGDDFEIGKVANWFFFIGGPIYGFKDSYIINSGVQWTLLYEFIFYGSLPLMWSLRNRKLSGYILVSFIVFFVALHLKGEQVIRIDLFSLFFIGGLCNYVSSIKIVKDKRDVIGNIGLFALLYSFIYTTPYSLSQFIIVGFSFLGVALGGGMFKLLSNKVLVSIGEVSYSIYMTHGIVLFLLFRTRTILPVHYSLHEFTPFIILVMILVSIFSSLSYRFIEKQCMFLVNKKN